MNDESTVPPQQPQWYRDSIHLRGQRIVDVGANVGALSAFFWGELGAGGDLLSIEPVEANAEKIRAMARASGDDRWRVERCAVGAIDGEIAMRIEAQPGGFNSVVDPAGDQRVPCRRLSALAPGATVVKLDIEGHEYAVLDEALPRMPQVVAWAIEFHGVQGRPLEAALGQLAAAGYQLFAAGRRASDPSGAWVSAPIPPTLSWAQIPAARGRDGAPFHMLHVLALRR